MVAVGSISKFITPNVKHGVNESDSFGRKFKLITKNLSQITLGKINRVVGLFTHFKWMNNTQIKKDLKLIHEEIATRLEEGSQKNSKELRALKIDFVAYKKLIFKIPIDKGLMDEKINYFIKRTNDFDNLILGFDKVILFAEIQESRKSITQILKKINPTLVEAEIKVELDCALPKIDPEEDWEYLSIEQMNDLRAKMTAELKIAKQLEKKYDKRR